MRTMASEESIFGKRPQQCCGTRFSGKRQAVTAHGRLRTFTREFASLRGLDRSGVGTRFRRETERVSSLKHRQVHTPVTPLARLEVGSAVGNWKLEGIWLACP